MKQIIQESLDTSISYQDYKELVKNLALINSTTGNEKTENLIEYTKLNDRRIKRWDKTLKVSDELKGKLEQFSRKVTWLVLTESWCGDAAHIMPVLNKITELNEAISLKVVFRDENEVLMNKFLTHGGRAIPKLIAIDHSSEDVLYTYGPRPSEATNMVNVFKAEHGKLTPEFKEDLQRWYNKDKGQTTFNDMIKLLESS